MSSSSNTTYLPGGEAAAGASGCCSTTTLFGALAASFALSFFLVTIFLCLRTIRLGHRQRERELFLEVREQEQEQQRPTPPRFGLDAAAIARIPSFPYVRAHGGEVSAAAVECAVCLSAVDEGETVRQLPACRHMFHQECIDLWLSSHASCPVCRGKAEPADGLADGIAGRIAATSVDVAPRVAMSVVVLVEMLEGEMVGTSLTSCAAASALPERLDVPSSGQETDLERKEELFSEVHADRLNYPSIRNSG